MELIYDYWVGHLTNVEQTLKRSIYCVFSTLF
jgi:hypothetical protein